MKRNKYNCFWKRSKQNVFKFFTWFETLGNYEILFTIKRTFLLKLPTGNRYSTVHCHRLVAASYMCGTATKIPCMAGKMKIGGGGNLDRNCTLHAVRLRPHSSRCLKIKRDIMARRPRIVWFFHIATARPQSVFDVRLPINRSRRTLHIDRPSQVSFKGFTSYRWLISVLAAERSQHQRILRCHHIISVHNFNVLFTSVLILSYQTLLYSPALPSLRTREVTSTNLELETDNLRSIMVFPSPSSQIFGQTHVRLLPCTSFVISPSLGGVVISHASPDWSIEKPWLWRHEFCPR